MRPEPGSVWTRSREHARVVPKEISDLFARCIRDTYLYQGTPSDADLQTLAFAYWVTPSTLLRKFTELAHQRREEAQAVSA